jgi:hypothetical protein
MNRELSPWHSGAPSSARSSSCSEGRWAPWSATALARRSACIYNAGVNAGVGVDFVDTVSEKLTPGKTAVIAEVAEE